MVAAQPTTPALRPHAGRLTETFERRWLVACVVGELVGFIPPAIAGAVLVANDASEPALIGGLALAGSAEGAILGAAQAHVLRDHGRFDGWVSATAVGAGLAWLAGMGGSSLVGANGPWALLLAVPMWLLGLLIMPRLQQWSMRADGLAGTGWVRCSATAWVVGVLLPVFALSVVPDGAPLGIHVTAAVVGAVAMGAIVGVVTGACMTGILTADER